MSQKHRTFEVNPRELGGWTLRLIEDEQEVGGGAYGEDDRLEAIEAGQRLVGEQPFPYFPESDTIGDTVKTLTAVLPILEAFTNKFPRDKAAIDFARAMLARRAHLYGADGKLKPGVKP